LSRAAFLDFAQGADLIILCWGKDNTDLALADMINRWSETIFVDGSEPGGNKRFDQETMAKILAGDQTVRGAIDYSLLKKCRAYFRREKPYVEGVTPLPFGIERRYLDFYQPNQVKDIDFFCIFGQIEFPPLRGQAQQALIKFCQTHHLKCVTEVTAGFSANSDKSAGRADFYKLLARSKIGISIGGGGFDTARFWEILANNCLLLTERIELYGPSSTDLAYERIWQFSNLAEFESQLARLTEYLANVYEPGTLGPEYEQIIQAHSTKARVMLILKQCQNLGLIT
jgi:hypothetical protein